MEYDEFKSLVKRMRDAQKAYFKHRKPGDLILSKSLETQVDRVISGESENDLFSEPKKEFQLTHIFDSSWTCDYCGKPQEKCTPGEICEVRVQRGKG